MKLGLGILGNVHLSVGVRIKAYVGVEIRPRDFVSRVRIKAYVGVQIRPRDLGNVHLSVGVRIKAYVGVQIRPRDFRKCTFKYWG